MNDQKTAKLREIGTNIHGVRYFINEKRDLYNEVDAVDVHKALVDMPCPCGMKWDVHELLSLAKPKTSTQLHAKVLH